MAIIEAVAVDLNKQPRRLRVLNPATREPVGEFDVASAGQVRAMVDEARRAQRSWAERPVRERARVLRSALSVLLQRYSSYVDVIRSETGRSRHETILMEIFPVCDALNYYARRAARMLRDRTVRLHMLPHKKAILRYKPMGVVGVITPWNGPFVLSALPAMQALVAGNAVVLKPSEVTPFSGRLVADLFQEAGLPEGLLHVALGDGQTGAALIDAGVDKISFTGSVRTGRRIGEECGRRLIPFTLELGGKDAAIVCADADLDRAVNGVVASACLNNGQVCVSTERVYVVDAIADEFIRRVVEKVKSLRHGTEGAYDLGPVIWERQLEVIERHVEDARARGAKILTGGRRNPDLPGLFYEPTVLVDVTPEMAIVREETFGPIIPIIRCRDEEEALRLANDSQYGLSGTIFSRDEKRATELAWRLETGSVCINDVSITFGAAEVPFGGVKQSGVGSVHGPDALRNYTRAIPVIRHRFRPRADEANWYPYTEERATKFEKALRLVWGTPLRWLLS